MCGVNRVRRGVSARNGQEVYQRLPAYPRSSSLSCLTCSNTRPILLMQDNRATMIANAACKEYVGDGKPFAHDPKTVRINVFLVQHSVHAHAAYCCSMLCAETLYPHADGMLHAAQSWINGANVAGLSRFILLCEPEVMMRVLSVQQAAVCSQLL
jgi:hypothetical protein